MRRTLLCAATVALLAAYACADERAAARADASADIDPAGGTVALDDVTLEIPAGALVTTTRITVSRQTSPPPEGYDEYSGIYRFEPEGLVFQQPVKVTIRHSPGDAPALFWTAQLDPAFYQRIEGLDEAGYLHATIDHFSGGFAGAEQCRPNAPCTETCHVRLATCAMSHGATEVVRTCACVNGRLGCDVPAPSPCGDGASEPADASVVDGDAASADAAPPPEVPAGDPTLLCVARIHGPNRQLIHGVASAGDGRVAIVGSLYGSADFGDGVPLVSAGDRDGFVAVYGPTCNLLWRARFGGVGEELLSSVAFDGAGNLVVGGTNRGTMDFGKGALTTAGDYDVVAATFDTSYSAVWARDFGDASYNRLDALGVDSAGDTYLAGTFTGAIDFGCAGGALSAPMYLAKLGPTGTCKFQKQIAVAGAGDYQLRHMSVDALGNFAVSGLEPAGGSVDLGGGPRPAGSGYTTFVGRFDANGSHVWSRVLAVRGDESVSLAPGLDVFVSVTLDTNGPTMANLGTGDITGSTAMARLAAADGATIWSRAYLTGAAWGSASGPTAPGGVLFTGGVSGAKADFGGGPLAADNAGDIFLARLAADGGHLYSQRFGENGTAQYTSVVASSASGKSILAGSYDGTIAFGAQNLANDEPATEDAFVAVFSK